MMAMLPGTGLDAVTLQRASTTINADGDFASGWTTTATGHGTYGTPSSTDQQQADARGEVLDAVVTLPLTVDVRVGDRLTVRGNVYVVTSMRDVRIHQRVFIRRTTPQ